MKIQYYIQLSDRIAWNNKSLVKDILSQNKDLDLLHKNGKFFKMAIESNSTDITEILLEYFINNQLSNYDSKSIEYYNLKKQLIEVIEVAIDEVDLLPEMKKVLSTYIDFEGSEHNSSSLDEEFALEDQGKPTAFKKWYSMNDLHDSTFDNSKENLLTEENLKKLSNNSSGEKPQFIEKFLGHHGTYDIKDYHSDLAGNLHNTDEL